MTLGRRLRQEREARNLTYRELTAVVGVKPNAQAWYEHDRRYPRADYLVRLYAAGWDVPFVLTGERSPLHATQLSENEGRLLKAFRKLLEADQLALEHLILTIGAQRVQMCK